MPPFGLCGQSYTTQSPIAASQKTQGWYPEFHRRPGRRATDRPQSDAGPEPLRLDGTGPHRGNCNASTGSCTPFRATASYATTAAGVITNIGPIFQREQQCARLHGGLDDAVD